MNRYTVPSLKLLTLGLSLLAAATVSANPYLDRYAGAQQVIRQMVAAHGGAERLNALNTVDIQLEGHNVQRHQDAQVAPPFGTTPFSQQFKVDFGAGNYYIAQTNAFGSNIALKNGDTVVALNPGNMTYQTGQDANISEHFINRLVPPLLARMINNRARNTFLIGESRSGDNVRDTLLVVWPNGNQYAVHVDRDTHLIAQYDILGVDPTSGDATFELQFSDYRDMDGLQMPTRLAQSVHGEPTFESTVASFSANTVEASAFAMPEGYTELEAPATAAVTDLTELAPGVYLAPGNYRTLYVEFDDHIVAVDAGGQPAQTAAHIAMVREKVGDKPLRYAVLTHHHNDHIQSVPQMVAEGATLITTEANQGLVRQVVSAQDNLLAANSRPLTGLTPEFRFMQSDRMVLNDDSRRLELYVVPNPHAQEYIVAYLPQSGIVYSADVFVTPQNAPPPPANDQLREFFAGLQKLNLDIKTVANAHGRVVEFAELQQRATAN